MLWWCATLCEAVGVARWELSASVSYSDRLHLCGWCGSSWSLTPLVGPATQNAYWRPLLKPRPAPQLDRILPDVGLAWLLAPCRRSLPAQAEMLFGATELTLRACNPRTGQRVDMRVAWEGETP